MQDFEIVRSEKGYQFTDREDDSVTFTVCKPNGKILCDCPDFQNAPIGTCDHIAALKECYRTVRPIGASGVSAEVRPEASQAPDRPERAQSETARALEMPFRPDQIKFKDGYRYVEGVAVIQRLNDVLGVENWSFRRLGDPQQMNDETIVRGRLTVRIGGRESCREDFGAHELTRRRSDGTVVSHSDTLKAAATDCIKRCAHQMGVALHLYCDDDSYHSFRATAPGAAAPGATARCSWLGRVGRRFLSWCGGGS